MTLRNKYRAKTVFFFLLASAYIEWQLWYWSHTPTDDLFWIANAFLGAVVAFIVLVVSFCAFFDGFEDKKAWIEEEKAIAQVRSDKLEARKEALRRNESWNKS